MHFLAVIKRKTSESCQSQLEALLEPEAEYVRKLYSQGTFRAVWSRGDVKGAVIELECEDREDASRVLGNLPFATAGLVDIEVIPLLPYRGFAPRHS